MKRIAGGLGCVLLAMHLVLPLGVLIASRQDYQVTVTMALPILTAVVAVVLTVLSFWVKELAGDKIIRGVYVLLAPVSVVNGFFCILIGGAQAIVWVLIAIGCSVFTAAQYGGDRATGGMSLILTVVMLVPVALLSLITLLFGGMGRNTVVKTLESPSGTYYAQVIDSDHGATGGDTLVNVYENKEIDAVFFQLRKEPQQVWFGDWGAYADMQIAWKDDSCLIINSEEYPISR